MENERKSKEGHGVTRHCAYCLQLCGTFGKLCGDCKRRAYCSKDCQVKDWHWEGTGQGHAKWCKRRNCGEEDIDWEVVPIPNKGLGIRAKKLILAGMKIIVEPVLNSPEGHPGIMDLEPQGGNLEDKFRKNLLMAENMDAHFNEKLALRIARVNHSCQPNAAAIYDETARVSILFAQKDIQPDEEICISYYSTFFRLDAIPRDPRTNEEFCADIMFQSMKKESLSSHGITCSTDCSCSDPSIQALISEGRQLYKTVTDLAKQNTEQALKAGEKILDIQRRLDVSWMYLGETYIKLFRVATKRVEMLPRAQRYLQKAVEIFRMICPDSIVNINDDGSKKGYCLDQMGNKYFYSGMRKDGCVLYRCTEVAADPAGRTGERCPAVACKIKEKIKLERPHKHSLRKKKKKRKANSCSIIDGLPIKKKEKKN